MSFLDLRGKASLSKQDCELFPYVVGISNQEKSGRTSCVRPLALLALSKFRSQSRQCLAPSVLGKDSAQQNSYLSWSTCEFLQLVCVRLVWAYGAVVDPELKMCIPLV